MAKVKTKTRKNRTAKGKALTIPELRSSMEYISSYADKLVHNKDLLKEKAKALSSEWKRVFGKTLKPKLAEDYLKNMMTMKKGKYTRKHRGGSPLAGAPIDYATRQPVDIPYGNYPKYVDSGFWNPEPAILKDGATQQVKPHSTTGSNKVGGGDLLGAFIRPFVAQNPPSTQLSLMNSWKGLPPSPGPNSYDRTWQARADHLLPAIAENPIYARELTQQGIKT